MYLAEDLDENTFLREAYERGREVEFEQKWVEVKRGKATRQNQT